MSISDKDKALRNSMEMTQRPFAGSKGERELREKIEKINREDAQRQLIDSGGRDPNQDLSVRLRQFAIRACQNKLFKIGLVFIVLIVICAVLGTHYYFHFGGRNLSTIIELSIEGPQKRLTVSIRSSASLNDLLSDPTVERLLRYSRGPLVYGGKILNEEDSSTKLSTLGIQDGSKLYVGMEHAVDMFVDYQSQFHLNHKTATLKPDEDEGYICVC